MQLTAIIRPSFSEGGLFSTKTVLVMKLTAFILLLGCLQVAATGNAQKVSLSVKEEKLEKVFNEIKRQTGYSFFYTDDQVRQSIPVTAKLSDATLEEALKTIFSNQPFSYKIIDKMIVVKAKEKSPNELAATEPPIDVHGRVVNEKGEPLEGVTVAVKGTKNATATDVNGMFELKNVDENATLIFSGVNVENQEVNVNGATEFAVNLKTKIVTGETVTVVSTGYQEIPKERATGSFEKVENSLINRNVSTSILDRIYGVTNGLNYSPLTGTRSNINIRGISTIFGNDKPLVVIDNVPYDGDINNINPNDVESVTILKDAAAASIWGVRAGNGVIVIVSKKARYNQKQGVQFTSSITVGGKPDLYYLPILSSDEFLSFEKLQFIKGSYNGYLSNTTNFPAVSMGVEILAKRKAGSITAADSVNLMTALSTADLRKDFENYLFQKSITQQNAINISGGSDKYSYYSSVGYDINKNNIARNKNNRLTLRVDNSYRPIKNLEINGFIVYTQNKTFNNGLNYASLIPNGTNSPIAPYTSLADANRNSLAMPLTYRLAYVDTAKYPQLLDWHFRPLDELRYSDNVTTLNDIRFGAGAKYSIFPGLNAEVKYQYEKSITITNNYRSQQTYYTRNLTNQYMYLSSGTIMYPVPLGGILDISNYSLRAWDVRGQINLNKKWSRHQVSAIAGTEVRELNYNGNINRKYGYNPDVNSFSTTMDFNTKYKIYPGGLLTGSIPNNEFLVSSYNYYISYYANAAYTFKDKYTLSSSGRIDESNFFGVEANQRRVPLWSAGIAWDIGRETFYNLKWLPNLKIRATYGYNGNTNNSATSFTIAKYSNPDAFSIINASYATIMSPPNPQLRWEKVQVINFGIDFDTKNRRIGGSVEYYKKNGLDLISRISVDPTTGVSSFIGNNATIKGQGIDVKINSKALDGSLKWDITLLFSKTSDKVTDYKTTPVSSDLLKYSNTISPYLSNSNTAIMIGKPLLSLYSYKWAGLNPANGDPRAYINDTVANYNLIPVNAKISDLVYNGPATPKIFGSFINTFSYKDFNLSFNIVYKLGYYFRRNSINYYNLFYNWGGHSDYSLRWQKAGDESNVPSLPNVFDQGRDQVYLFSNILVEKADHIKLQDIRLGYDLNKRNFRKLPFPNCNVFMYVRNLGILWSANKHKIDPDYGDSNIPPSKSFSMGVNINL
jgi:TonB-linked SusC/RagA family outer membrane protein